MTVEVREVYELLKACTRFEIQDLRNRYSFAAPRELALAVWRARELLRVEDGIDFGPVRGFPGLFERKEWDQIAKRGERQRAKGTRAHRRAAERLRLASSLAPPEDKERLDAAADRIALRMAMRAAKG